jgi:hypothetical protein
MQIIRTQLMCLTEDVKIRGYFSKPKEMCQEKKAMDLVLLNVHCNENRRVGSHKETQWRYRIVKHIAKTYKLEYK